MNNSQIQSILEMLGKRVPASSRLFLLGGSALILLGSPRPTPVKERRGERARNLGEGNVA